MRIRDAIKRLVPYKIKRLHGKYKGFLFDRERFRENMKWEKHRVRGGEDNPNKTFYVLRREPNPTGILSIYLQSLGKLKEMESRHSMRHYIPIIDLQTDYFELCDDRTDDGTKRNAWDRYFSNLSDYSIEAVMKSKHIVLSDGYYSECGRLFFDNTRIDERVLADWREINQKYFHLLPELLNRFEQTRKTLLDGYKVLGVMIRDDYVALSRAKIDLVNGHPRQPTIEDMFDQIDKRIEEFGFNRVFLVAESVDTNNLMMDKYGDCLITTNRHRWKYTVSDGDVQVNGRVESMYQNNVEYLEEVYLLSKCEGLLAGKCSGSIVAALWNDGKYDVLDIMKLGSY